MTEVTFKNTAFIDGVRYRPGTHEYNGDTDKLPADALIDGKPQKGRETKKDPKVLNQPEPVDEVALRDRIRTEMSQDPDLRKQIEEELRKDEKLLDKLREEIRQDKGFREQVQTELRSDKGFLADVRKEIEKAGGVVTTNPADTAPTAAAAGPFTKTPPEVKPEPEPKPDDKSAKQK